MYFSVHLQPIKYANVNNCTPCRQNISFFGHDRHVKVRSYTQPDREAADERKPTHIEVIVPERDTVPSDSTEGVSSLLEKETSSLLVKETSSLSDRGGESEPCQGEAREQGHTKSIKDTTASLSRLGLDPSILERSECYDIDIHVHR